MNALFECLRLLIFVALLATGTIALGQSSIPDIQWSKTTSRYNVSNNRIVITTDGAIYSGGYKLSLSGDTLLYLSAPNYPPGTTADGGLISFYFGLTFLEPLDPRRFFAFWGLQKKDASGQVVFTQDWFRGYGPGGPMSPDFGSIRKVLGTPDNGYILLNANNIPGYSYGSITNYNAMGDKRWDTNLIHLSASGQPTPIRGEMVINTPDGGLLVTGYLPGVIDDPFNAGNPSTGWVGKYDAQGNLLWEKLLTSLSFINQNRVRSTYAITDACLSADGNGYALVGSGYGFSSLAQAPPQLVLLELDQNGNLKRSNTYAIDPTPAFVALYRGGDGKKYYMAGNTSLAVPGFDYRLLKISTDPVTSETSASVLTLVAQRTFSLSDVLSERLTDIDVAGDGGLVLAGMTGIIKLRSEQQPVTSLSIGTPTYDCLSGQLTVNVSGDNGSPLEYQILGLRGWSNSPTFSVPDYQRQGTTFRLDARQHGQGISTNFITTCSSTLPPPTGEFALLQPNYSCETGVLTMQYTNGREVEYRVPGLRDWGASPTFMVPSYQRTGTTFMLEARSSGKMANLAFTTTCNNTTNPPENPQQELSFNIPTFQCDNGRLIIHTT